MEEGYIKFECIWEQRSISIPLIPLTLMNKWRSHLKELDMIGQLESGQGFGNLSFRNPDGEGFFISGNNTGHLDFLEPEDVAFVEKTDLEKNTVWSCGKVKPSSEAINHSVFYQANPTIKSVVHIHCNDIWKKNLNKLATTSLMAGYGTVALAKEIQELIKKQDDSMLPIIIISGHKDGIFAFGRNINIVGETILKAYRQ